VSTISAHLTQLPSLLLTLYASFPYLLRHPAATFISLPSNLLRNLRPNLHFAHPSLSIVAPHVFHTAFLPINRFQHSLVHTQLRFGSGSQLPPSLVHKRPLPKTAPTFHSYLCSHQTFVDPHTPTYKCKKLKHALHGLLQVTFLILNHTSPAPAQTKVVQASETG